MTNQIDSLVSNSQLDLNNIDTVLEHVTRQMEAYYRRLETETDVDSLIKLGSSLATLSWFMGHEEAKASAELERMKAQSYLDFKTQFPESTIPIIENSVKLATDTLNVRAKKLYNAMRSLNTFLTQLSIRIKNLRTEKLDNLNQFQ